MKSPDKAVHVDLAETWDPGAFYEEFLPVVYSYFRRRVADAPTAEDLTAETFARIVKALPKFQAMGNAERATRVWVYKIAGNVYKNALRGRDRRLARDEAWAEGWRQADDDRSAIERSVVVGRAMATLDSADRDIVGLRFWEGLTAPEIAAVTGLGQREVYTAVERAIRHLRNVLEEPAIDEEHRRVEA